MKEIKIDCHNNFKNKDEELRKKEFNKKWLELLNNYIKNGTILPPRS